MLQHMYELSLGNPVAIHDDAVRLEPAGTLVEHYQQLLDHARHLLHYLLPAVCEKFTVGCVCNASCWVVSSAA